MKGKLLEILEQHFKPEFLNRVDETVVFHPLGKEQIKAIAGIQLSTLLKRVSANGYDIVLGEHVLDHVAEIGYDPVFGARPLRRAIQNYVEDPLSRAILAGEVETGKHYVLDFDSAGKLTVRAK